MARASRSGEHAPSEPSHDGEGEVHDAAHDAAHDEAPDEAHDQPRTEQPRDEHHVAEREVLLFLSETDLPVVEQPSSVLESAVVMVLERLDPLEQQGAVEDPLTGRRLLPGVVSLTPISMTAFFVNCAALVLATLFCLQYARSYLLAFSVYHAIFFGHLWTYYVAYRTRKRFLGFRQMLFVVLLVAFVDWMMLDLIAWPPAEARARARLSSTYETYLWAGIVLDSVAGLLVLVHWAVLGRGYREAPLPRPGGRMPRPETPKPREPERP